MEKAWDILNKLLDNFNLGRACIYTFTGLLFVVPLAMTFTMLFCEHQIGLRNELIHDLKVVFHAPGWLLLASYVLSFPVVSAMYQVIKQAQSVTRIADKTTDDLNLNKNFATLTSKGNREPLGWLISEYFRFVEAVVYIPIGIVFFLLLMSFYFVAGIPRYGSDAFYCAATLFGLFLISVLFFLLYWKPRVIMPTIQYFLEAKRNLISGLNDNKSNSKIKGQSQHG